MDQYPKLKALLAERQKASSWQAQCLAQFEAELADRERKLKLQHKHWDEPGVSELSGWQFEKVGKKVVKVDSTAAGQQAEKAAAGAAGEKMVVEEVD